MPYKWEVYAIQIAGVCECPGESQPQRGMLVQKHKMQMEVYFYAFTEVSQTRVGITLKDVTLHQPGFNRCAQAGSSGSAPENLSHSVSLLVSLAIITACRAPGLIREEETT